MWQQILKAELASESGYAQLDFDSIVEGEEANCKQKLRELALKLENIRLEVLDLDIDIDEDKAGYLKYFPKGARQINSIYHVWDDTLPEEVYCKAIELYREKRSGFYTINFMGYSITANSSKIVPSSTIAISKLNTIDSSYPPFAGEHYVYLRFFLGRAVVVYPEMSKKLEAAFDVV